MSEGTRNPSTPAWAAGVCVTLIFYFLSWGPMAVHYYDPFMFNPSHAAPAWVQTIYAPVEWLRSNPSFLKISDEYWHWCATKRNWFVTKRRSPYFAPT